MSNADLNGHLRDAALRYAEMGFLVFPCIPGTKKPLTPHGFQDATTDQKQIEAWWKEHPHANVAIAITGQIVVDVDGAENPWLRDDPEKAGQLASGSLCLTPRDGRHFYFRQPAGKVWGNSAGKVAPKVDTRGRGGYVLVSPSVVNGKSYRWADGMELDEPDRLPEPPLWLQELLDTLAAHSAKLAPVADERPDDNLIPEGRRNDSLARLAGSVRRHGMTETEILSALLQVNRDRCRPPLDDAEVCRIASSIAGYPPGVSELNPTPEPVDDKAVGLTRRLSDAILSEHHFADDGGRELHVFRDGTYHEGGSRVIEREVKRILLMWKEDSSWTSHRVDEVIRYIQADCASLWVRPPLDTLNLKNGLLAVESRVLRPHSPDFLSSVQLPVAFDPEAGCPEWEKFVREVFPDDAEELAWQLAAWLMLANGNLQKAILLLGEGANGKSTFLMALRLFLGRRNVSEVSLHRLESDRFAPVRLAGKLANISC